MHQAGLVSTAPSSTGTGGSRVRRSLVVRAYVCSTRRLKHSLPLKQATGSSSFFAKPSKQYFSNWVAHAVDVQQHVQLATPLSGLLCLPGTTTPTAYSKDWSQRLRPQLDALWGSILRSSNAERVLLSLDDLMMQLRSSKSLAVHLQQQHQDSAWRAAATQVATGCQKYETYIYTSKTLTRKLNSIHRHLQHAVTHNSGQEHKSQFTLLPQQLLQLCRVLLACVTDQLAQDSLSWLAAQELPDPNAVQLQQHKQQEKDLIAAVDDVIAHPVLIKVPTTLDKLVDCKQPQQERMQPATGPPPPSRAAAASACVQSTDTDTSADGTTPSPVFDPECGELVYVTRSVLAQLLQRCNDSNVRRKVYLSVLQPKLTEATSLLDKLARSRQLQAQLTGFSSYSELVNQRVSYVDTWGLDQHQPGGSGLATLLDANRTASDSSSSSSSTELDNLLQLASVFQDLAAQEVMWMQEQQQQEKVQGQQHPHGALYQSSHEERMPQEQNQRDVQALSDQQHQMPTGPWDWDYLLYQTQQTYLDAVRGSVITQHMHVSGVLAGFDKLLQRLLGVELSVRPAGASEVWEDNVIVLSLMRCQHPAAYSENRDPGGSCSDQYDEANTPGELLGTIYLDIGGSYGCRMLRYTRESQHIAGARTIQELQQQVIARSAVAVGLSGRRPSVPGRSQLQQQHQPQQQQSVQDLWQRRQELDSDEEDRSQAAAASSSDSTNGSSNSCGGAPQYQSSAAASHVLSLSQLWEFGHEMGHALHLILSSRQAACHLSGRFLRPDLLELPSHIMERLFTCPEVLSQLCLHHQTLEPLPAELSAAVAAYYGCRYNSALALSARTAAALAEQMYCEFGGDGENYWRQAWMGVAGLPETVAQCGSLREVSLLPVMAAHQGTYHCYLGAWCMAADVCEQLLKPALMKQGHTEDPTELHRKGLHLFEDLHAGATSFELQQLLVGNHYLSHENGPSSPTSPVEEPQLQVPAKWVWRPLPVAASLEIL